MPLGLGQTMAVELCSEGYTVFPPICYKAVANLNGVTPPVAVALCKRAVSNVTSDCFREAINIHSLSVENAINLCTPKVATPVYSISK